MTTTLPILPGDTVIELDPEGVPIIYVAGESLVAHLPGQHDQADHAPGGGSESPKEVADRVWREAEDQYYKEYLKEGLGKDEARERAHSDAEWDAAAAYSEAIGRENAELGVRPLTPDEHSALDQYGNWAYKGLNEQLRTGIDQGFGPGIENIDSAFGATAPVRDSATVYRGMVLSSELGGQLNTGAVFQDRGFISTAPREREAQLYTRGDQGGRAALFEITIPPGARMIDMLRQTFDHREDERLLPRGSEFRIDSKEDHGEQVRIKATLVGYPSNDGYEEFKIGS